MKSKKIIFITILSIVSLTAVILFSKISFAQGIAEDLNVDSIADQSGLTSSVTPGVFIANIIKIILAVIGVIFLIIVIVAGAIWMTSGGNQEKIAKAKKMIVAGVIGIAIILFSYVITTFIVKTLIPGVIGPGGPNTYSCIPGDCIGCHTRCNEAGNGPAPDSTGICYEEFGCTNYDESTFRVTDYDPDDTNVSLCSIITVIFNHDVASSTVSDSSFKVCEGGICSIDNQVSGIIEVDGDAIIFDVSADYEANTTYRVELGAIEDTQGNSLFDSALNNFYWTFTTGNESDNTLPKVVGEFPEDGEEDVCTRSHINADFSESMDIRSLRKAEAFALKVGDATSTIQFNRSASLTRLELRPKSTYISNTLYTAILNSNIIQDTCGNKLDGDRNGPPPEDFEWNFTTGQNADCSPEIISVVPSSSYYDSENSIIITGKYLSGASVIFNNGIIVNNNSPYCMNPLNWYGKICNDGDSWTNDQIKTFIPIGNGLLNTNAKTGKIKVRTNQNSNEVDFTVSSPQINSISNSSGGIGQFITLSGENFGNGELDNQVYFRQNESDPGVSATLPCGEDSWSNNNIIISVPEVLGTDYDTYYIQVKNESNFSNLVQFNFTDQEAGPGLCIVAPEIVKYEDPFSLYGVRFGASGDILIGSNTNAVSSTVVNWNETSADSIAPNLARRTYGVRIKSGEAYSNSLPLTFQVESSDDFRITSISPTSTTVGGYVTIYGSGFGSSRGDSKVVFKNDDGEFVGSFDFPSVCLSDYWSDNRIIVKVPSITNTTNKISVAKLVDETYQYTNEVDFSLSAGSPGPSICSMSPQKGTLETQLTIKGEYFITDPEVNKAVFSYTQYDDEADVSNVLANSLNVLVPSTQTGLFALRNTVGSYGNSWNFEYLSSVPPTTTERFDFYGWHFTTCDICKNPRVKVSPCIIGGDESSSPSPYPGSKDVPYNARISLMFEYPDETSASMASSTITMNNFEIIECGNAKNPNCGTSTVTFSNLNIVDDTVDFEVNPNMQIGYWYRVEFISDGVTDIEGNPVINDYVWSFRINPNGEECKPDKLRIEPDNKSYVYGANNRPPLPIIYSTHLIQTMGCYHCNNSYNYDWDKFSVPPYSTDLIGNISNFHASHTPVVLNSLGKLGTVGIRATNTELLLTDTTNLKITGNCNIFNEVSSDDEREQRCIDENDNYDCCWNSVAYKCENLGSPVCRFPYVKNLRCITGSTYGEVSQLGSPSPIVNSIGTPIDSIIHAQFAKSGTSTVQMNTSTYAPSTAIIVKNCGTGATPSTVCYPFTNISLATNPPQTSSIVNYSHVNFAEDTWYEVTLTDNIKDIYGYALQPKTWTFKTGTDVCRATNVSVAPNKKTLNIGNTQPYSALCHDNSCNICTASNNFNWNINPAIIASLEPIGSIATATASSSGVATITATNIDLSLSGKSILNVRSGSDGPIVPTSTLPAFKIISKYPTGNSECPNTLIKVNFSSIVDYNTLSNNIQISGGGSNVSFDYYTSRVGETESELRLNITSVLATSTEYTVSLKKNEIKSIYGANLECGDLNSDGPSDSVDSQVCFWKFTTAASVCELNHVYITKPLNHYYEFNQPAVSETFIAEGRTSSGKPIVPLTGVYDWKFTWSSLDSSLITVSQSDNSGKATITSQNKNGKTKAKVIASTSSPAIGYLGGNLTDQAEVELFMCNNVWKYEDTDFNFELKYCRDGGLPALTYSPLIKNSSSTPDGLLREYIFTYDDSIAMNINESDLKNGDTVLTQVGISGIFDNRFGLKMIAKVFGNLFKGLFNKALADISSYRDDIFGLRIYENPYHVSAIDWYKYSGVIDFQGNPQSKTIDSYQGIIDGRTTYVNASNIEDITAWTNIYLISKNQSSSPQTTNIFNQLLNNWRFNTNTTIDKINLIKDTKRWEDLRSIEKKINSYGDRNKYCYSDTIRNIKCSIDTDCSIVNDTATCMSIYPSLQSGTYQNGITTSLWPSWNQTLGSEIGGSLPLDPDNVFTNCTSSCALCDPQTCWDDVNHTFYCPTGSKLYYYQYQSGGLNYTLYGSLTFTDWGGNNNPANPNATIRLTNQDVCHDYTPIELTCGNEVIDEGEECDTNSKLICEGFYNEMSIGCGEDCRWQYPPVSNPCYGKCGDGIVQSSYGEECDGTLVTLNNATCENCRWICDPGYDMVDNSCVVIPICGNNIIEEGEVCDRNSILIANADCEDNCIDWRCKEGFVLVGGGLSGSATTNYCAPEASIIPITNFQQ